MRAASLATNNLPPHIKYRLHLDYETFSEADLRRTGAERYGFDTTTDVLCVSYRFVEIATGTARYETIDMRNANTNGHRKRFVEFLRDCSVANDTVFCAWNAAFERAITKQVLGLDIPPHQWRCTMARAAFWGLPMKLDDAGAALGVPAETQKSKTGHALMMKLCRPRKLSAKEIAAGDKPDWSHHTDENVKNLMAYCAQDVTAEIAVHSRTPELPDIEQRVWELDQIMNIRGVGVDLALVKRLHRIADEATAELDRRMHALTKGAVPSARNAKKLLSWVNARLLFPLPDLKRGTIKTAVAKIQQQEAFTYNVGRDKALEALEIRADAARSSAAKLDAMLAAAMPGVSSYRIRGLLQYYGAGRTGRWAGRLVQPQNMPRPSFKTVTQAVDAVLAGATWQELEMLFPESALGVVSGCLRACFTGDLVSGDSSQIEARMVAWLAGQQDILDVFARKEDVYVYTAAKLGSKDRQFGKVLVLACGFGMGAPKFQDTALTYGVKLALPQAEDAVRGWRNANPRIVQLWYDCDGAARRIASGSSNMVQVRSIRFERVGRSMFVWLPSGRPLVYREIGVEVDPRTGRDSLVYMGVDQKTRKWAKLRTYGGKLVENITQAAARDVLRDALLEAESQGLHPILTVHDEIIGEPAGDPKANLNRMLACLQRPVAWAPGLPLGAEGWAGKRYRK
jgi:DNA polymerase